MAQRTTYSSGKFDLLIIRKLYFNITLTVNRLQVRRILARHGCANVAKSKKKMRNLIS